MAPIRENNTRTSVQGNYWYKYVYLYLFNDATNTARVASNHSVWAAEDLREAVVVQFRDPTECLFYPTTIVWHFHRLVWAVGRLGYAETIDEPPGSDKTLNT